MMLDDKQAKYAEQDWLTFNNLKDKLSRLDAYPKTLEDFRIKTLGGGTGKYCSIVMSINIDIYIYDIGLIKQ